MNDVQTFPAASKPDAKEIKQRNNAVVQSWRFAVLNLKMLAMVRKGHH